MIEEPEEIEDIEKPLGVVTIPEKKKPTTAEMLKELFISLCDDFNIEKRKEIYSGCTYLCIGPKSDINPYMDYWNNGSGTLIYNQYRVSLSKEESKALYDIYTQAFEKYYNNLIETRLYMEKIKKSSKADTFGADFFEY